MSDDPYYVFKEEIEYNFLAVITLYDSWNRIYNTVSSRNNEELKRTEEELEPIIKSIESDLDEISQTIRVVESDPVKYSFITSEDIESRREFVEQKKEKLKEIRSNLKNPSRKKSNYKESDRDKLIGNFKSNEIFGQSRHEEVIEMDNVKLIENESLQQTLIMREQDKQLESLYGTARNIHEIAATIGNELEDQNALIEEFDERIDRSQSRLDSAMKKVVYVIKKNEESKSTCCIGILMVILFVLLILVIVL